jgi:hypothetical protein
MKKVDYSSDAITRRLKKVDQLRVLCLSLTKAKKAHDEKLKIQSRQRLSSDREGDTTQESA